MTLNIVCCRSQQFRGILEPAKTVIALVAKQTAYFIRCVAMICGEEFNFSMPEKRFWLATNSADPALGIVHLLPLFRSKIIYVFQIARSYVQAPLLIGKRVSEFIPSPFFCSCKPFFFGKGEVRWLFECEIFKSIISVLFFEKDFRWSISFSIQRPHNSRDADSICFRANISIKFRRFCASWMPMARYIADTSPSHFMRKCSPSYSERLRRIIREMVTRPRISTLHGRMIAHCGGGCNG